ncbi:MAG: preprotein translocase subunit SecA, partial [Gaiellaceae bacterium]
FQEIYDLSVVEIPTNERVARADENDYIYRTKEAKYDAVLADIEERHELGQPILVGTISVEVSEHLSQLLTRRGITHNVLNAKQHEREAEVIKDAGEPGAVTIATNMAGRGVDIKLGPGVVERGGLYVLGTERHEARRIDNQLRGRSGRQGDPGESRFYLSAQDDLVRLFAGDRINNIMERFKLPDDQPMEAGILSKQIENAQKKVEEQNFVSRKNVLKYDDVMNVQRMVIYEQRRQVLEGADLSEEIAGWLDEVVARIVFTHTEAEYAEEWDLDALFKEMETLYETEIAPDEVDLASTSREELIQEFQEDARDAYKAKVEEYGPELMREIERFLILQVVDLRWREHLEAMEYLRDGIHLRAMAQKDPLAEYRAEGHVMFEELRDIIREEVVRYLLHVQIERPEAPPELAPAGAGPDGGRNGGGLVYEHESLAGADAIQAAGSGAAAAEALPGGGRTATAGGAAGAATSVATSGQRVASEWDKVGRNDP